MRKVKEKRDFSGETVTNAILNAIKSGVPAWRRPWRTMRAAGLQTIPQNGATGRAYRGINIALTLSLPYDDQRYFSYDQAQQMGGQVRRNEKGNKVVAWLPMQRHVKGKDGKWQKKKSFWPKIHSVFNIAQCDWSDAALAKLKQNVADAPPPPVATPETAIAMGTALDIKTRHGGDAARYLPMFDRIEMPIVEAFTNLDAYLGTSFHEHIHSTGHPARVGRQFGERFGDDAYAMEELVAELGSAYLCNFFGVDCALEHHASYVQHWNSKLSTDLRAVITASSAAQKAVDYVLAKMDLRQPPQYDDGETTEAQEDEAPAMAA
jgi:antirestriction protein ArdC